MFTHTAEVFATWFELDSSPVAIGVFEAQEVTAIPLPRTEQHRLVWKVGARPLPRHPPRPASRSSATEAPTGEAANEDDEADESRPEEHVDGEETDVEEQLRELLEEAGEFAEEGFALAPAAPDAPAAPPSQVVAAAPAASSNEAVPAEPAPLSPMVVANAPPPVAHPRKGAEVTYIVPGGTISYYSSKRAFEAVCCERAHGRCVLTRTARGKSAAAGRFSAGGRPVGFLAAWLGEGADAPDKATHWLPEKFSTPHAARLALRRQIAATPDGRRLLSFERPAAEGEGDEPETLDGVL